MNDTGNVYQGQKYINGSVNLRTGWLRSVVKSRWAYVFIAPFFLLFAVFGLYPVVQSFLLSFTEWKGLGPIKYIGLDNYTRLLTDRLFWETVLNSTIIFVMYVPPMLLLALVIAMALNSRRVRGFKLFRTILFMPYITNMVAAGFAFRLLLDQRNGLFNSILGWFGIAPVPWLESVVGARLSLCLLLLWAWLGYNMVIMLAGLQTIPAELNEAAKIDGANNLQSFWFVTLPLMQPTIVFCLVLSTIGSFALFTEVYTLTGGGPFNSTNTPIITIFGTAFTSFKFGYASAQSYAYFAIIFVLTLIQVMYFRRKEIA